MDWNDRQQVRNYLKKWHAEHPEKKKLYTLNYYSSHRGQRLLKNKLWREQNHVLFKQLIARNYKNKKIERKKQMLAWYLSSNGQASAHKRRLARRCRALKARLIGSHTISEWEALLEQSKGVCSLCGEVVGIENLTRDHIVPISSKSGADDSIKNIQPACKSCNCTKGAKSMFEFKQYLLNSRITPNYRSGF